MFPRTCLFLFDAGSRRLGSNNFRNSSYKEKTAVLVRVSYDYGFIREYISLSLIPWKSHQKIGFKIHELTKNLFRLNIFEIYLPLKLIVFTVHIFSIITFSLYQTKIIFAFRKRINVDHFYHKCVIEY